MSVQVPDTNESQISSNFRITDNSRAVDAGMFNFEKLIKDSPFKKNRSLSPPKKLDFSGPNMLKAKE
jgi:hypothetical protein